VSKPKQNEFHSTMSPVVIVVLAALSLTVVGILSLVWFCMVQERKRSTKLQLSELVKHELISLAAVDIARLIREGSITSTEVTQAYIEHIKAVNPIINAFVAFRFETALKEAKDCDTAVALARQRRQISALPPLFGVPMSMKECIAVRGMPQTSGLKSRVGMIADADATVVQRLRAAGAIILGVTNVSELCMWYGGTAALHVV
jgi:Asp-tRNA(Asn)/Glu-tRNA(Gln) amidotransferase A subunit family amidase